MQIRWLMHPVGLLLVPALALSCSGGSATSLISEVTGGDPGQDVRSRLDAVLDVVPDLFVPFDSGPELSFPETVAEVDVGPQMGEAGWPCTGNSDCISGFCIPTSQGKQCTIQCEEECPFGWECALHEASLPDELFICVAPDVVLCRPCNLNTDCLSGGADAGAKCVHYGNAGLFCATPCSQEVWCETPYLCLEATDATGADVDVCVLELPQCQCTPLFADQGAWTTCVEENEAGACQGQRMCTADGLSECDAAVPVGETCNGVDDDCDGEVDEETSGGECVVENDAGTCPGTLLCMGGTSVCDGPDPEPESCDGVDNDCNGETDEGFPDTDEDGVADCMETDKDGDTVVDGKDNCQYDYNPAQEDFDLDGFGDVCDPDDDGDKSADGDDCNPWDDDVYPGAPELCDGKDNDCDLMLDEGFADWDADGFKDCVDEDDDNDGFVDDVDCRPQDVESFPGADEKCDGIDNNCDNSVDEGYPDADQDGLADCLDTDQDGDGVANDIDNCVSVPNPLQEDKDGDGTGDACDSDVDGDGVPDNLDNCPGLFNPGQADLDEDGQGDLCDQDKDDDGVDNPVDNCPHTYNPGQEDEDQDKQGDACDDDDDGDTVPDVQDNCPMTANADQQDTDADGIGDACEEDLDGDKVPDAQDNCPLDFNPGQEDCDADDVGDACQADDDSDGIVDGKDNCLCMPNPLQGDIDGDGLGDNCDTDKDGDGIANGMDNCPGLFNPGQADLDNDKDGDACDTDLDGDGWNNDEDNCPVLANAGQQDLDEDNTGDACDDDDDGDGDPDISDCAPGNEAIHHQADELCDGIDNNCALGVDEGFLDTDLDAFKDCVDSDDDNDSDPDETDCAPLDPAMHAQAPEKCNGIDDNCNQQIDEGFGLLTCGLGVCQHSVELCQNGALQFCNPFEGAGQEVCDGQDNDCDSEIDESQGTLTCGLGICLHSVAACEDGQTVVCDPLQGAGQEACDGLDNDCDGPVDEGLGTMLCGQGKCQQVLPACLDGEVPLCDPFAGAADEVCNGADDDCDGFADEELGQTTCGQGPCEHTVENCIAGIPQVCNPQQGATDEICFNGIDEDCSGEADDGCVAKSCLDLHTADPNLPSGAYSVDPDGEGGNPAFEAWCDMETDNGGWTMVAWYTSNQELHIFDATKHQVQSSNNGSTVAAPPKLWQDGVWGHVAYNWFPASGRKLKMQCRNSPSANWFSYTRDDLFSDWSNGDKGSYGNGNGWGVLRWLNGRSGHWVCGQSVGPNYQGVGYCKGPGVGGKFTNHVVSISFDPDHNYGGGTAIGCNGSGIDHGKSGQWQGRIWIR